MKTSKLFSLVFVLVFVFSLGFAAQAQDTTISFLTPPWGVPPDEDALNAFMEESGITVEIQSVQLADLFSRVQVSAAAGQPPADVIFITEEGPSNIVATGNVMALGDFVARGDLPLDDLDHMSFWTLDGDLYVVPTYQQLVMMDYNAAKLAEAVLIHRRPPGTSCIRRRWPLRQLAWMNTRSPWAPSTGRGG